MVWAKHSFFETLDPVRMAKTAVWAVVRGLGSYVWGPGLRRSSNAVPFC